MARKKITKKKPAKEARKQASNSKALAKPIAISEQPKVEVDSIPLVWVDRMELALRGGVPLVTLRFYSGLPNKLVETCRLQTTTDHVKKMVDVFCDVLEYTPAKR